MDGAYGATSILNSHLKMFLNGIEKSDAITFDAHKWLLKFKRPLIILAK